MKKWRVIIALASAQFVMVLDGTVMNVSINEVVQDLDTTVTKMQLAITLYTLTMASLMMVGGKIGDVIGRRRAFRIGLVIFATGAGITAAAPNITILMIGWSVLEGVGAALMIPAIAALIAGNYKGRDRAAAYGVIGGIAGAAAASGPIIGGYVSTEFSWRYVFGAEVFIMAGLLLASVVIKEAPFQGDKRPKLDGVGAALSISGLAIAVLGVVQSTDWGWIYPKGALSIGGTEITPFGFSVVPFLILAGIVLLGFFVLWEQRMTRLDRDPLIRLEMLKIPQLRAGLSMFTAMFMVLAGTFFVLPLYLEIVLGKDPLQTGIQILPLSIGLFVVALGASRLSSRFSPKRIVRVGLLFMLAGAIAAACLDQLDPGRARVPRSDVIRRYRPRAARLPAWQRQPLLRRREALERGRRPAGHLAVPRLGPRHGDHRLDPADGPDRRLRQQHREQPEPAGAGPHRAVEEDGEGDPLYRRQLS